jgi:putative transposase
MPRSLRAAVGGIAYHVLNRANARRTIFAQAADYELFLSVLAQGHQRVPTRTIGYCLMPNHWHLVLWPRGDGDLSEFMRWVSVTHTQRWHAGHGTAGQGHLYQGRFKSFPVQQAALTGSQRQAGWLEGGDPLLCVLRYVQRNPLRAGLVTSADLWPWSSLADPGAPKQDGPPRPPLTPPPDGLPADWLELVNRPQSDKELAAIVRCVQRGAPFGREQWVKRMARELGLESTLRARGRPKLEPTKGS